MLTTIVQSIEQVWQLLMTMMGMSPLLLIPTFLLVELVAVLFKLKQKNSLWKNSILGVLCLLAGLIVIFATMTLPTVKAYLQMGVILGSLSAITYQIVKPLFKFGVLFLFKYIRKKTGDDTLSDPEFLSDEGGDG